MFCYTGVPTEFVVLDTVGQHNNITGARRASEHPGNRHPAHNTGQQTRCSDWLRHVSQSPRFATIWKQSVRTWRTRQALDKTNLQWALSELSRRSPYSPVPRIWFRDLENVVSILLSWRVRPDLPAEAGELLHPTGRSLLETPPRPSPNLEYLLCHHAP